MKKIILSFILAIVTIVSMLNFTSCNQMPKAEINKDSIRIANLDYNYYQSWFTDFENKNPNWVNDQNGFQILKDSFNNKMLNDLDFVRSVLNNPLSSSSIYHPAVARNELITKYNNEKTGEYGEAKAFLMRLTFELQKPTYDGKKEYSLYVEVINMIPSTVEYHFEPYIFNIDTCMQSKSLYFNNLNCSDKIVGSFIVGPIPDNK